MKFQNENHPAVVSGFCSDLFIAFLISLTFCSRSVFASHITLRNSDLSILIAAGVNAADSLLHSLSDSCQYEAQLFLDSMIVSIYPCAMYCWNLLYTVYNSG